MAKPTILTVDDDRLVSTAIARDLADRYGAGFRVVAAGSGDEALDIIARLGLRGDLVALLIVDQRMPRMTGVELLRRARPHVAGAKTLLLTAYADTDAAIAAINEIDLDYYLLKPWDPPEDHLYPVVDGLLDDWRQAHPDPASELRIVGHRWSERAHEIKQFLARNHVPYQWYDLERDAEGERLRELAAARAEDLPLVLPPGRAPLRAPTSLEVAVALGLHTAAAQPLYDVCIVGGGPAGLAAAVYAASEGLRTVVVERQAPGGQAGQSASIENYLGFPRGLSGAELAHRALAQVSRFGAELVLAREVTRLERRGPVRAVCFEGGEIETRAVIVATGVSYRRLAADGIDDLVGRGVYYGADASEAAQCAGDVVFIVGAANSAGQAALNLARHARRVVMVVRGADIADSMSQYLVNRITAHPAIEVRQHCEVTAVAGAGHLERLTMVDRSTGSSQECAASWLFVFIGAAPRTEWLGDQVIRDSRGFIVTGPDLGLEMYARAPGGPLRDLSGGSSTGREPYALETSMPGVFAAGDVRLDSMKRVASAIGEGAMAIHLVHRYLAQS